MTETAYIIAKFFAFCGVPRKNKRLTDANNESHLLKKAELVLGSSLWPDTEAIEGLNVEYWALRKLEKKKDELQSQLNEAHKTLESCSNQKSGVLDSSHHSCSTHETDYERTTQELNELCSQRDKIIAEAHLARRKIDASRTKVEVLSSQPEALETVKKEQALIIEYEKGFDKLKESRNLLASKIAKVSQNIESIEESIARERAELKNLASAVFQNIGKANQEASKISSEIGLVESEMQQSFIKVGYHLSLNVSDDKVCSEICKNHVVAIHQMRSLRESITRNQKIATMAK